LRQPAGSPTANETPITEGEQFSSPSTVPLAHGRGRYALSWADPVGPGRTNRHGRYCFV